VFLTKNKKKKIKNKQQKRRDEALPRLKNKQKNKKSPLCKKEHPNPLLLCKEEYSAGGRWSLFLFSKLPHYAKINE